jgi:acyl carrier protein
MTKAMTERVQLREFVGQRLRERGDEATFDDADALLSSGRLDSVDVITLAVFLEQSFGVDLTTRGFDQNDFETVQSMLSLIGEAR